ncbi:MAG: cytochrome c oxidase accessory protein CcoG [Marinibacterium sp.]
MSNTENQSLYAAREPIFPRRVSGWFRNLKWWIMGITLGIYYLTPWIRWDRGPDLPDQAVLIDLANRRFYFFWIEIWPHEFYFVAGLLIMAGLGLFLFTSALGRVWCGYTCPQTVWTDLFLLVERWIEGDRNARVRLWNAPWSTRKIGLRAAKFAVWFLIALATGGAWVFYFADAPTLLHQLVTFQAPAIAYTTILVLAGTTFVFGGFMREQVCIYMCPWPRIQAAMMDPDTLTVAYRDWRGEPRGKHRKAEGAEKLGDCIDCKACVNVCPMGIDIRNGQQLECITCALCIDACDDVMAKIGKERGLIDYLALSDAPREQAGEKPRPIWHHVFRIRTIIYTILWSAVGVGLLWALFIRSDIDMNVSPIRNPQYITLSDGSIRNAYDVRLRNMYPESREFRLSLPDQPELTVSIEGSDGNLISVPADETANPRVYVIAPKDSAVAKADRTDIRFWVDDTASDERIHVDTVFNGKGAK